MGVPQGDKPPEIEPLLRAAPRIKQVYWCKFPLAEQQHKPEFSSTAEKPERPVVVLSRQSTRRGVVTVVPLTRADQKDPHRSVRIKSPLDGKEASWAVCNHITTVAVSRLRQPRTPTPQVDHDDFQRIVEKVMLTGNLPDPIAPELTNKLKALAKERGATVQALLEEAVDLLFDKKRPPRGSATKSS